MSESVQKTKHLTEAAVAVAITALLVMLKLIFPPLVYLTMIAGPAPIALITLFHGVRWGVGTSLAVIIVVTILGGVEIGLTTAVYAGALGLAIGYGTRAKIGYKKTLLLTAAAYLIEMSYKIIFSIYVLGLTDTLSSVISRFIALIKWIWVPLSGALGFDPDPGKAAYSTAGAVMVGVIFVLNAFCYAYLAEELFYELYRRMKNVRRA